MAEKSGELKSLDKLDPVSTTAGVGGDQFMEKHSGDKPVPDERALDAGTDGGPAETEHIKARIKETRNQMGETIDAIQERLSFANISEQVSETVSNAIETAKDTAYEATIGQAVNFMKDIGNGVTSSDTFKTIKTNPVPFALIGIGAGLLAYQSFGKNSSSRIGNGRRDAKLLYRGEGSSAAGASTFDAARESVASTASRAYDGISDTANTALESVSNAAGKAYEGVTESLGNAYTGAGDLGHRAYDRVGEYGTMAHEKYDEYLEENPLALGALAVAVGAAVGFAIPSTRYEGKLMGDARENVIQRAQEAAGTLVDKAKQVASEAGQTIKEETRSLTQ
ncbi:MAG: DUF3618 domain-containing protein [Acidobacteriota bacterium]